MLTIQIKGPEGRHVTNRNYFPEDWKTNSEYRMVARHHHGHHFCSDGFRHISNLDSDPLYACKTSSDEFQAAAEKRVYG